MTKKKNNGQLCKEIKNMKLRVELAELQHRLKEIDKPKPEFGFHV